MASKYIFWMSGSSRGFFGMAQGRIEDAAFAVHFGPGNGEVVIFAVDPGVVEV